MKVSQYTVHSPRTLPEALNILKDATVRPIAGGTDVMVQIKDDLVKETELLNLSYIRDLNYIRDDGDFIRVGALATYSDLIRSRLVNEYSPVLVEAARTVGAVQIQNRGTLAGNVGNASPAGDGLPPLFATGAKIKLQSAASEREVDIGDYFLGVRKTVRQPNELITEVSVRKMKPGDYYFFKKIGLRSANAISLVSVAAVLVPAEVLTFKEARIAMGAVAPTVIRAKSAEAAILNCQLTDEKMKEVGRLASEEAHPITDIRATAEYRKQAIAGAVYEGLYEIVNGFRSPVNGSGV
jgi:CO/xanthine dehydrogenase FAD-binding subunit